LKKNEGGSKKKSISPQKTPNQRAALDNSTEPMTKKEGGWERKKKKKKKKEEGAACEEHIP